METRLGHPPLGDELKNEHRIVLISPPPSDPTQPYSSLPSLAGFLRGKGFEVIQLDLGIRAFDELTSPRKLEEAKHEAILRMEDGHREKGDGFSKKYFRMIGLADFVIEHVEEAKRIMRDPIDFYDLRKYDWASSILKMACELLSLPCHPTEYKPYDYLTDVNLTFKDILGATTQKPENLFYSFFNSIAVPEILTFNPFLVGISVTYGSQIVPSFTLARLIKKASPEIHLCIGGATISQFEYQIMKDHNSFLFADSYIVGEGETALFSLANNVLTNSDLRSGPNVIVKESEKPVTGRMWHCENVEELPSPDFSGLDLNLYLSPEPVFLIESSRGCYHSKCTFCNVSMNKKRRFRSNARGQTASLMRGLFARYGVKRFFLCDDAIPYANMKEIAQFVRTEAPSITWAGEARFESTLSESIISLRQGGCRQLIFGLESLNQRVLDLMDKGNTVENDIKVINACKDAGLAINLQTFIGFPSETKEEAWRTIEFVLANKDILISYGFCTFDLCRGTPIFNNPDDFGVAISPSTDDKHLSYSIGFEQRSGMKSEEVENVFHQGMAKLEKAFGSRTNYLCRTEGAHALLHLSYYDWKELIEIWQRNNERHHNMVAMNADTIVHINPAILFSYSFDPILTNDIRALNTETGKQYSLSSEEQSVLDYCMKPIRVMDALESWLRKFNADNKSRTINLVKGAIAINKLYINNIIKKVS